MTLSRMRFQILSKQTLHIYCNHDLGPTYSNIFWGFVQNTQVTRSYKDTCLQATLFRQTLQLIHLGFGDGYKKHFHRIPEPTEKTVPLVRKIDGCDVTVVYLAFECFCGECPTNTHDFPKKQFSPSKELITGYNKHILHNTDEYEIFNLDLKSTILGPFVGS